MAMEISDQLRARWGRGTAVGIDHGSARIGVALSRSWILAEPGPVLEVRGRRHGLDLIAQHLAGEDVALIVVGLPLLPGGEEGEQAAVARAFAASLRGRFPKAWVEMWDERHSSQNAEELLRENASRRSRADSVAAALILQEFLDSIGARLAGGKKR